MCEHQSKLDTCNEQRRTTRRRIVNSEEEDAYTRWRELLGYMRRPGVVKAIKRRTHKRERRVGRAEARQDGP